VRRAGPGCARPVVLPRHPDGEVVVRPSRTRPVYAILLARAAKANVQAFSPHDLRRSCVSDPLGAGVDISVVQPVVGHDNVTTTARYDRRGEQAKKKAAKSLHVPFVAPVDEDGRPASSWTSGPCSAEPPEPPSTSRPTTVAASSVNRSWGITRIDSESWKL